MRSRAIPSIAVAVVLLLAAACSDDGHDDATLQSQTSGASDESASTTPADDDQGSEGAERSRESGQNTEDGEGTEEREGTDAGGSLGSGTGQHPAGVADDTLVPLRIDVTSLQRNGELVELAMTLTNEHESVEFRLYDRFKDEELDGPHNDLSGIKLIDQGERRAYLPVLDSDGICLCSDELDDIVLAAGESYEFHATFGGMPDTVTTLDLDVPGFSPIAGLEVQG